MKKIRLKINQRGKMLLFCLTVNIILLIVFLFIFRPAFETNDDAGLANMVNGAKGKFDPHLIYSNYMIGLILAVLYRIKQWVPWYTIYQYALMLCSFTALMYVIVKRSAKKEYILAALTVVLFFAYECYIKIQFTKTAGVASAAGIYLLFYAMEEERMQWPELICGYILAGFGFMVRKDQFLAEFALLSAICLIMLFKQLRQEKKVRNHLLLRDVLCAAGLFALIGGLYFVDEMAYQSPQWQEYRRYNDARSELLDYGFPKYDDNKEAYEKLGIDRSAYKMLTKWNHMDPEVFSTETLEGIIALKKAREVNSDFFESFFEKFPFKFTTIPSFWMFLIIFTFSICWGHYGWSEWIAAAYELILITILYLYLFYCGRYLLNRVDVGIWLSVSLVALWSVSNKSRAFSYRTGILLFAAVLCMQQNTARKNWRVNTEEKEENAAEERAVLQAIHADLDHLYVFKPGTISFAKAYPVFSSVPFNMAQNFYPLGGWTAPTPLYQESLEKYGVTNPFRDIIGNEKIYLIDNSIDSTVEYLQKHYDKNVKAVSVTQLGKYKVYKIEN